MKKMEEPKVELVELGEDIITSSGCPNKCPTECYVECTEQCIIVGSGK